MVLLGTAEVPVAELIRAVLARVATEAHRVAGAPLSQTTLTCPASWAQPRRSVLASAAAAAGLPAVTLVPEPVAAAQFFLGTGRVQLPIGGCVVVYDLGGGTFDASVVRRNPDGFEVLATEGLSQAGGLDIDAAIVEYLGGVYAGRAGADWRRLTHPATSADRRASQQLWDDVRSAKETLSRNSTTAIYLPVLEQDAPLGREQLETLARPILEATITTTRVAIGSAGVPASSIAGLFLVGGGSRVPLAATLLQQAFQVAPTAIEQPELVVAQGSLAPPQPAAAPQRPAPAAHQAPQQAPQQVSAPPRSAPPYQVSPAPHSAAPRPVAGAPVQPAPPPRYPQPQPQFVAPAPVWGPPRVVAPVVMMRPAPVPRPVKRRRFPIWARLLVIFALLGGLGYVALDRVRGTQIPHVDLDVSALSRGINATTVSPNGELVAAADIDGNIRMYRPPQRAPLATSIHLIGLVSALAFSPDGRVLATGTSSSVALWDTSTGNSIGSELSTGRVTYLKFSKDGKSLASLADYHYLRIDLTTGLASAQSADDDLLETLAVSTDGAFAVAGVTEIDNSAIHYAGRLFDGVTGKPAGTELIGHQNELSAIAISPDGATIVTCSDDRTVRLWSSASRQQLGDPLLSNLTYTRSVRFSPDGSLVAIASRTVRLYSIASRKLVVTLGSSQSLSDVYFGADNRTVITAGISQLRVWTLAASAVGGAGAASASG